MTRAAAGPLLVPLLALTGTVLLAWGAALARPRPDSEAQPARPGVHAVLLDVSGSAVRGRRGHLRWCNQVLLREARRASAAARDLCVVQVAAGARIAFGPADPALLVARLEGRGEPFVPGFEEADQHRSRIDDGVAVLQAVMAETGRAAGTLVLVVDDTRTGPDPNPRLWSLAREGHGVELTPLPPADRSDLALVEVRLPREVEADAPSAARLELRATALPDGASASLEVTVTGPGGATTHAQPLSCPSDGTFSVHLPLPARGVGEHLVSLRARLDGDVVPENDRLTGNLRVGDARVVLVCARDPHHEALRAWAGAIPGLQLEFATPAGLATRLHRADALLTVDLGPSDLPESITDWVRAGGGWLGCFGWSSFGSWSPPGEGGLSDLCALTPKPGDGEARDVMLLVDGSGSMDGEPFERVKRAVFELVTAALPSDSIELRFFTDQVYGVAFRSSGQSLAERRAELAPLLNARVPRGGTDIGESLIVFAGTRLGVERRGLVLLLTDGIGTTRRATEVRGRLSAAGLDLRILQVGDDPKGRQFLEGMLLEGEEVIAAGNLSDLGRLLQHEVNRERVREDPGMRAVLAAPSGALGAELLPGWSPAGFGEPLVRYARAEVVGAAEVLWASSREAEPLLAVQRVGEGLVATLAGLPGAFPADA
ncbi:MAG: VWA domain-containing protein, partial [Planctomycetota bacterium]|nr:VWA domain-containing protein [Planctomycetota bacterium]